MSKGSILVVDDESEIREGLELLLAGEGYGVCRVVLGRCREGDRIRQIRSCKVGFLARE